MSFWDGTRWVHEAPTTSTPPKRRGRLVGAAAEASLITLLIFGLISSTTFAAKGGRGNITVPDGVYAATVTATLNPGGDTWAHAACYQDGTMVYGQYVRSDANNHATFTLGPTPLWTGGDASCTAEELSWGKNGRWHKIASTTFSATDPN